MPIQSEQALMTINKQFTTSSKRCTFTIKKANGKISRCRRPQWKNTDYCYKCYQRLNSNRTARVFRDALPDSISEKFKQFENDVDILDLRPNLALLQALLVEHIKVVQQDEQILTDKKNLDKIILLMNTIIKLSEQIDKIEKSRGYHVTIQEAQHFISVVLRVLTIHIEDTQKLQAISNDLETIQFKTIDAEGKVLNEE